MIKFLEWFFGSAASDRRQARLKQELRDSLKGCLDSDISLLAGSLEFSRCYGNEAGDEMLVDEMLVEIKNKMDKLGIKETVLNLEADLVIINNKLEIVTSNTD